MNKKLFFLVGYIVKGSDSMHWMMQFPNQNKMEDKKRNPLFCIVNYKEKKREKYRKTYRKIYRLREK